MLEFDHRVVLIARDAALIDTVVSTARPLGHPLKHFDAVNDWLAEVSGDIPAVMNDSPSLFSGVVVLEQQAGTEASLAELQQVCKLRHGLPVIVIAHEPAVTDVVTTMRMGAFTVLTKPCSEVALTESIQEAMAISQKRVPEVILASSAARRMREVNEGERAVLDLMLAGKANKEIAHALEIGLRTVELRRSRVMKKMQANSLAELVRLVCAAQTIS